MKWTSDIEFIIITWTDDMNMENPQRVDRRIGDMSLYLGSPPLPYAFTGRLDDSEQSSLSLCLVVNYVFGWRTRSVRLIIIMK